ncbi:MAG TPA: hypothetical protein DDX98_10435 [Bacteroidales bacterium]|jgi:hypothetical protein|nr:hypothetical protein [Bacteroidales bacterium]
MDNKKLNIEAKFDGNEIQIVERRGLDSKPMKGVEIKGLISAPYDFIKKKHHVYEVSDSFLLIDESNRKLILELNTSNPYSSNIVYGQLEFGKMYRQIGVNSKNYTIDTLREFVQMNPHFFPDQKIRKEILRKLWDFKAQFNTKVENMADLQAGKRKVALEKSVAGELDIVKTFQVQMPMFTGDDVEVFDVELFLQVANDEVQIQLFSESLILKEHEAIERRMKLEYEKISRVFDCSQVKI